MSMTFDVFSKTVTQLRSEYLSVTGHTADDDGYHTKPHIKAILILHHLGVPAELHAKLMDRTMKLNLMRIEHLKSHVSQHCRIPVDHEERMNLVAAMVRRLWLRETGGTQ